MSVDPANFAGKTTLVIKCTDGSVITHYLMEQNYNSLPMTLSDYAQSIQAAHEPDKTYEDHALESTQDLEQFIFDGGDLTQLDVVSGAVVYPP